MWCDPNEFYLRPLLGTGWTLRIPPSSLNDGRLLHGIAAEKRIKSTFSDTRPTPLLRTTAQALQAQAAEARYYAQALRSLSSSSNDIWTMAFHSAGHGTDKYTWNKILQSDNM